MGHRLESVAPLNEDFIRFEVQDGIRRISCAVRDEALEAVWGLPSPSTAQLRRRSFDRFRMLIHAAATMKLGNSTADTNEMIMLTAEDLRLVPAQNDVPAFGYPPSRRR